MNRQSLRSARSLFVSALVALASSGCFIQSGDGDGDETDTDDDGGAGGEAAGGEAAGGEAAGGEAAGGQASGGGGAPGGSCETDSSACSTSFVESDWSIAELEIWSDLQTQLDQHVNLMNMHCETEIVGTFAYETFRGHLEDIQFGSIMDFAVFEVQQVCLDSQIGKETVQTKISQIVMVHAGGSRAHSLGSGRLSPVLDTEPSPSEWTDAFAAWLGSAL